MSMTGPNRRGTGGMGTVLAVLALSAAVGSAIRSATRPAAEPARTTTESAATESTTAESTTATETARAPDPTGPAGAGPARATARAGGAGRDLHLLALGEAAEHLRRTALAHAERDGPRRDVVAGAGLHVDDGLA